MKEKQFNGAYWSPFLLQIINKIQSGQLYMDEKETNMILNVSSNSFKISNIQTGFLLEDNNQDKPGNFLLQNLIHSEG